MKNVYPQSFKELWKMPGIKKACVTAIPKTKLSDCENCGGLGVMYSFIADGGPFESPGNLGEVSKFAEGKWWVGKNYADQCPVCHGSGVEPGWVQPPIRQMDIPAIVNQPVKADYTDY
jgi:hypothetical protein